MNSNDELTKINQKIAETKNLINTTRESIPSSYSWWSVNNAMTISSSVLFFGILVIVIAAYLIKIGKSTEAVLRVLGTILIIVSAVFLVVAGYSDKQIAPVIGLLGTIAGYLLGKETSESKNRKTITNIEQSTEPD